MKADLHIHSLHSADGEYSVEELLADAARQGIRVLSITDHNSVAGVAAAHRQGRQLGITVVPGLELDCTYGGLDLHLLGYCIDWRRRAFAELERQLAEQQRAALPVMLEKLAAVGIAVTVEEVLATAAGKVPCGELVGEVALGQPGSGANPLLRPYLPGGMRADLPYLNFYRDFFAQGKPAYVPLHYMTLPEAVSLVKAAGGVPVIAHPGESLRGEARLLEGLAAMGVQGVEAYSSYHSREQTEFFRAKAEALGLIVTCGSDFHGKNKPTIPLGSGCTLSGEKILDALNKVKP